MKIQRSIFALLIAVGLMMGALSAAAASSNDRENRAVKVINEASSPVFHLYVSNVDQNNWGPDQLSLFETIGYNRYMAFNMDDGSGHCMFDIKAVLKDGRFAIRRNFNVCTEGSWTVTD